MKISNTVDTRVKYRVLTGFDDPTITAVKWNELVSKGCSNVIFMTWQWQKAWWEAFGRGKLLLIAAEQTGDIVTIAPLFADEGMIYLVGSGGSDYLNFVGKVTDVELTEGLLVTAIKHTPDAVGFLFYHLLDHSETYQVLKQIAEHQNWNWLDEGEMVSPMLAIKEFPDKAKDTPNKRSLVSAETWFNRNGGIQVEHFDRSKDILNNIDTFFEQHVARWSTAEHPSLFLDSSKRLFYKRLCELCSEVGWFRLSRITWNEKAIAFHFGFNYQGNFFFYIPSYEVAVAKHSPGQVLLRQMLLRAQEENAHTFDFGLGDEGYKMRFATNVRKVKNLGLYLN